MTSSSVSMVLLRAFIFSPLLLKQLLAIRQSFQLASSASSNLSGSFPALDDNMAALKLTDALAGDLVARYHPVFSITSNSCLPAAAISRGGKQNGGLKPSGSMTGGCRNSAWMKRSNTYHRFHRQFFSGAAYEVHVFELYFEKDMSSCPIGLKFEGHDCRGHRHDVESVIIYFKNGVPVTVGASAHGGYKMKAWAHVPKQGTHPKIVYFKDNVRTHSFRFARSHKTGRYLMPPLASWFLMTGDGVSNAQMRAKLNAFKFGSATFKTVDADFIRTATEFAKLPGGFPYFSYDTRITRGPLVCCGSHDRFFDESQFLLRRMGSGAHPPSIRRLQLRSGRRVDGFAVTLADGTYMKHGGSGGRSRNLYLAGDEYVTRVDTYRGKKNRKSRIFFIKFYTSKGRSIQGGRKTRDGPHVIRSSDPNERLVGFHGRAGRNLMKLGGLFFKA